MIVMKRNGQEDQYTKSKIHNAIDKGMIAPLLILSQTDWMQGIESVSVLFL